MPLPWNCILYIWKFIELIPRDHLLICRRITKEIYEELVLEPAFIASYESNQFHTLKFVKDKSFIFYLLAKYHMKCKPILGLQYSNNFTHGYIEELSNYHSDLNKDYLIDHINLMIYNEEMNISHFNSNKNLIHFIIKNMGYDTIINLTKLFIKDNNKYKIVCCTLMVRDYMPNKFIEYCLFIKRNSIQLFSYLVYNISSCKLFTPHELRCYHRLIPEIIAPKYFQKGNGIVDIVLPYLNMLPKDIFMLSKSFLKKYGHEVIPEGWLNEIVINNNTLTKYLNRELIFFIVLKNDVCKPKFIASYKHNLNTQPIIPEYYAEPIWKRYPRLQKVFDAMKRGDTSDFIRDIINKWMSNGFYISCAETKYRICYIPMNFLFIRYIIKNFKFDDYQHLFKEYKIAFLRQMIYIDLDLFLRVYKPEYGIEYLPMSRNLYRYIINKKN